MNNLNVKTIYSGYDVEANFSSGLTLLTGNSGDGKSFLLKASKQFCKKSKINCLFVDDVLISDFIALNANSDLSEAQVIAKATKNYILDNIKGTDIILLDNADLYLTDPDLISKLRDSEKIIVVSMKKPAPLGYVMRCIVRMSDGKLELE